MNPLPKPSTTINSRGHPTEFEQIIQAKSHNFVGREFVFTAIHDFIHRHHRGYFTIIGAPGSGKSAIAAKYAMDDPHVVYYNAELEGKNRAEEFLRNICTQLIDITPPQPSPQARREQDFSQLKGVPNNATEGSWFLSSLLQQISDELEPNQKLIIAIDGLNYIDRNSQAPGTNLFYLPRYLPDGVYFLLTRRPFLKEKSGLLIETPSQILDLADYPQQNQQDIQAYIQQCGDVTCNVSTFPESESNLKAWLTEHNINEQEFGNYLTTASENNFMYLSQIINAIGEGFYTESLQYNQLPPGLEAYYQQHLQQMIPSAPEAELSLAVLNVLVQQQQPITVDAISQIIDTDEYEVEEVLENWLEFLDVQQVDSETYYRLYHDNFRQWLGNHL